MQLTTINVDRPEKLEQIQNELNKPWIKHRRYAHYATTAGTIAVDNSNPGHQRSVTQAEIDQVTTTLENDRTIAVVFEPLLGEQPSYYLDTLYVIVNEVHQRQVVERAIRKIID